MKFIKPEVLESMATSTLNKLLSKVRGRILSDCCCVETHGNLELGDLLTNIEEITRELTLRAEDPDYGN